MDLGKIHFGRSINFSGKAGFRTETNNAEMVKPGSKSFLDVLGEQAVVEKYGVPAPPRNTDIKKDAPVVKYGLPYIPSMYEKKDQPPMLKYAVPNMDNKVNNQFQQQKPPIDVKNAPMPLYAIPAPDLDEK